MSLDVYLRTAGKSEAGSGIFIRENGSTREISRAEWDQKFPGQEPVVACVDRGGYVFDYNITHNLGAMADAAGIYEHLWSPEEVGVKTANDLVGPLADGLAMLKADPAKFKAMNPANGWGNYDGLVAFVEAYLEACKTYPHAEVSVSR